MGRSHQCYIPSLWKSVHRFQRGRFLKGFYHIWAWQPFWSCDQHHVNIFSFLETESLHIKFGFIWPSGFWEKPVLSFICNWLWVKVKKWPWPYSHMFIILCNSRSQAAKVLKNQQFSLFPIESLSYQIRPCCKIGQGQPRIIIWTNYDGQESLMLHTKFHGNRSTGSREEDFWRVFAIYGHGSHLGHVTSIMSINFHFLIPESLHIKFGFDLPSGFWEKQGF